MSLLNSASLCVTPNGYKAGTLYSVIPNTSLGDMTVVRATTATRVNSAGLIESVANNVPRLDYSNGTCPSLLVEPQRTNLALYSEQFDNAYWTKSGTTIVANDTLSPSGIQDADKITNSGASGDEYIQRAGFTTAVGTYTSSIFVKNINATTTQVMAVHLGEGSITSELTYTWSTGAVVTTGTNAVSGKATTYDNGWVRLEFTYTIGASVTGHWFRVYGQTGLSTNSIFIWGAQLEAGSYPTSYIPTTSAAVTRNADVISKTGISSLIGQTEGVVFLDLFASAKNDDTNTYGTWLVAGTATENFQIYNLGTTLYWYARNTGGIIIDQTANETLVEGTRYKIAFAYKSGDYALYINGVQKRTSANANVPVAVSQFNLSGGGYGAAPAVVKNEYNSAIFFPTRLTNAELISLTS